MQKLKDLARRSLYLSGVAGLLAGLGASAAFSSAVFADALNPLTERTLLLSSSAPGYINTDGSGNSTYAPPGSGANGQKTGETFTFKISTAEDHANSATQIKAFTLQYCTAPAGLCQGPGDDAADPGGSDDADHSDLNVHLGSGGHAPSEISSIPTSSSTPPGGVLADDSQGTFAVETWDPSANAGAGGWVVDKGWEMTSSNQEEYSSTTGKNNFITLTKTASGVGTSIGNYLGDSNSTPGSGDVASGTQVKVQFFATDNNYITNPGSNAFFVKINDFNSTTYQNWEANFPNNHSGANDYPADVVDGGVTVANVMNNSIYIRTKVLETLDFSVGIHDPNTDNAGHGACDAVDDKDSGGNHTGPDSSHNGGVIYLGSAVAEHSLSTHQAYDNFSFFRLSSNSSNGATVYYSGNTLADTENDQIGPIYDLLAGDAHTVGDDSAEYSHAGTEQFGLGLDVTKTSNLYPSIDGYVDDYNPAHSKVNDGNGTEVSNPNLNSVDSAFATSVSSNNPANNYFNSWHMPQLYPLAPMGLSPDTSGTSSNGVSGGSAADANGTKSYGLANGSLYTDGAGARFAFNKNANTIPVPIAGESTTVVNCSTGLMRYVGNIAATTPAGIYTTSINYLAAPEY